MRKLDKAVTIDEIVDVLTEVSWDNPQITNDASFDDYIMDKLTKTRVERAELRATTRDILCDRVLAKDPVQEGSDMDSKSSTYLHSVADS